MARRKGSWRIWAKRGWAYLDFWWKGKRFQPALRLPYPTERSSEEDRRRVEEAAAKKYAETISGRRRSHVAIDRVSNQPLEELVGAWLDEIQKLQPDSFGAFKVYGGHFVGFFDELAVMASEDSLRDYQTMRLSKALRRTVQKEMSAAMRFLRWCHEQGALGTIPPRPALQRGLLGKRTGKQRAKAVDISREEALRIIQKLPEWSSRKVNGKRYLVRDRMRFAWELGLRPGTLDRIEVPRNWQRGSNVLELDAQDDKARFARALDLTRTARAILEKRAPERGLIFGAHDLDGYLKKAAAKVLDGARAKAFAAYDIRHRRARFLLDQSKNLRGVAYVLGHRQLTTTNRYVAPDRQAGRATLRSARGR